MYISSKVYVVHHFVNSEEYYCCTCTQLSLGTLVPSIFFSRKNRMMKIKVRNTCKRMLIKINVMIHGRYFAV